MNSDDIALQEWWVQRLGETDPVLTAAGITAQWWSFAVDGSDGFVQNADDIEQAIAIVVTTPRGSDVHRPEFASNIFQFIDWPQNQATPNVIREVITAVERWETRVRIDSVSINPYTEDINSMVVSAAWSIIGSVASGSASITVSQRI